jgi:hypothetical protein
VHWNNCSGDVLHAVIAQVKTAALKGEKPNRQKLMIQKPYQDLLIGHRSHGWD